MSSATLVLHLGFVVAGMATTLLGPILPALTVRWAMTDVVAGSLFTAQFLSSMTATLVAPAIAARIGARGALALGFGFLAVGTFTIGIASHPVGMAATVAYGLGLGLVLPLTNIAIAATHPDRAASALSLVNVSWGIGAVIWPMVVRSVGTVRQRRRAAGDPRGGLRDDGVRLPACHTGGPADGFARNESRRG